MRNGAFLERTDASFAWGRLQIEQLRTLKIPQEQEPARLLWLSRVGAAWHRESKRSRHWKGPVQSDEIYPPAFREMLDTIWEVPKNRRAKTAASAALVERVVQHGNPALWRSCAAFGSFGRTKPGKGRSSLRKR